MTAEKRFLSIIEAAAYLCVGRAMLQSLVSRGTVPSLKVGGRRLIPKDALDRWVDEQVQANRKH